MVRITQRHLEIPAHLLLSAPKNVRQYVLDYFSEQLVNGETKFVAFLTYGKIMPIEKDSKGVAPWHPNEIQLLSTDSLSISEWIDQLIKEGQILFTEATWDDDQPELLDILSKTLPSY